MRSGLGIALARRAWIIGLCVVAFGSASLVAPRFHTKQYTASSALLFREQTYGEELFGETGLPAKESALKAATNDMLVLLPLISRRTARTLPGHHTPPEIAKAIEVQLDPNSNVIRLNATDSDPAAAAAIADMYAKQYVEFSRGADRRIISKAISRAKASSAQLLQASAGDEARLTLERAIARLHSLDALQTGDVDYIQPAVVPSQPSSPRDARDAALGATIGLVFGLALALLLSDLDRRVRDAHDLGEEMGLPVLSVFGGTRGFKPQSRRGGERLPTLPSAPVDMLRARLRYFNGDRDIRTVLVTSSGDGDGKTTLSWNLAMRATASGVKTILMECDFQKPTIAGAAGYSAAPGLAELLSGQCELADVVQQAPYGGDDAESPASPAVVVAGGRPPNGAALLESQAMEALLEQLKSDGYQLILIDTAPLALSADAIPLLGKVDGVIIVGRIGRITQHQARALAEQLRVVGAPLLGAVANAASPRDALSPSLMTEEADPPVLGAGT